jgi:hypothetical protein
MGWYLMMEPPVEGIAGEQLARAMEEGYRQEAECSSLEADWATVESDGLGAEQRGAQSGR